MGNLTGRMPTQTIQKQQNDAVENRQRVATHIDGNTVSYEDADFTSADDQSVLNVLADLGRTAHEGFIVNDGPGEMAYELSFDGTTYGGLHTVKSGEVHSMENMKIAKVRLTHIDDIGYRVQLG